MRAVLSEALSSAACEARRRDEGRRMLSELVARLRGLHQICYVHS